MRRWTKVVVLLQFLLLLGEIVHVQQLGYEQQHRRAGHRILYQRQIRQLILEPSVPFWRLWRTSPRKVTARSQRKLTMLSRWPFQGVSQSWRYCTLKDERWRCNDPKSRSKDLWLKSGGKTRRMPRTPLSYTLLSNNKNSSMEKRRFRPQSRLLPRRGRASWPRNAIDDFWRRQKLQSRFLLLLRSKVTNRSNQVRFPFQRARLRRTYFSFKVLYCRPERRNCPIVQVSAGFLSIGNVVAFDRRAVVLPKFQTAADTTIVDVWIPTVRKFSWLCSQLSVHASSQNCFVAITISGQFPFLSVRMTIRHKLYLSNNKDAELQKHSNSGNHILFTAGIMNNRWAAYSSYFRYIVSLICNGVTHRKRSYWSYEPGIKFGF